MSERLQNYYDDGMKVYRSGQIDPAAAHKTPGAPRLVCKAVSHRQAQIIAAALNFYLPKNERRAIKRDTLSKVEQTRLKHIKESFGLRNSGGAK